MAEVHRIRTVPQGTPQPVYSAFVLSQATLPPSIANASVRTRQRVSNDSCMEGVNTINCALARLNELTALSNAFVFACKLPLEPAQFVTI
jgi:hypothetical protein